MARLGCYCYFGFIIILVLLYIICFIVILVLLYIICYFFFIVYNMFFIFRSLPHSHSLLFSIPSLPSLLHLHEVGARV